jgi:two-component system response regulator MprA
MPAHRHTVMVVDDERETRDAIQFLLEAYGFAVTGAVDGADALRQLKAGVRPCVILLDLMMPRMNGWSFRYAQRADAGLADIPVGVFTAHPNAKEEAEALGAEAWFRKPPDIERILDFIDRHCTDVTADAR